MEPQVEAIEGRVARTLFAGSLRIEIFPFAQATQTSPGADCRSRGMEQILETIDDEDDEEELF